MKEDKQAPAGTRRDFLRRAGQTGMLAGAAAIGAASVGGESPAGPATKAAPADKGRYHETEHIREYYRTSGIF